MYKIYTFSTSTAYTFSKKVPIVYTQRNIGPSLSESARVVKTFVDTLKGTFPHLQIRD